MADGIQWDDEAKPGQAGGIQWDQPTTVASDVPPAPPSTVGGALDQVLADAKERGKTALHHGLAGYFADFSDELSGQVDRLDPRLQRPGAAVKMPDGSVKFIENGDDAAAAGTALERDELKRTADAHPVLAFASNMGGSMLRDATLQGVGVPVMSLPYQIAAGALSGAGAADDNMSRGMGATLGGAAGLVGSVLGEHVVGPVVGATGDAVVNALPESVRNFAAKRALKAAGYIAKDIKPIARRNPELLAEKGGELLRAGVIQPGRTVENVADLAAAEKNKYGEAIGKVLETADELGGRFNMDAFVKRAKAEVLDPMIVNGKVDPSMKNVAASLKAMLDDYEGIGSTGFAEANKLKSNLQSRINWGNRWNDAKQDVNNELLMQLQGILLDEVDNQLGDAFQHAGAPGQKIRDAFKIVKNRYGIFTDAEDKARMGVARELGNGFASGKDILAALGISNVAAMSGHPGMAALGLAAGVGSKLARERGDSVAAVGANKLAGVLEAASTSAPMKWLVKVPTEQLERYAGPLSAAAARGPQALAATVFALAQQDDNFRTMQKRAQSGE